MGLMRRAESRVERSVGALPRESASKDPGRDRPKRNSKYYVQPAELARKLVKEMEDHKVSHSSQEIVCNVYTVYLCPEDFERLFDRRGEVEDRLRRHLEKRVRSKRYQLSGDLKVSIVVDEDLPFGRFGILAERLDPRRATVQGLIGPREASDKVAAIGVAANAAPATPAATISANGAAGRPATNGANGSTRVIAPKEAEAFGLAHQALVLRAGNRVREFNKGRVVIGRGRDADFRVDDPNVSRRHAAIFWDEGRVMVQDLDSTNGTMVNGYPVTTTVLHPDDVVVIGECRITVEGR